MPLKQPWLRRHTRFSTWLLVIAVSPVLVSAVALIGLKMANVNVPHRKLIALAPMGWMFVIFTATGVYQVLRFLPAKRHVVESQGQACGHCLFDLRGLGNTGHCPECGRPFDISTTSEAWKHDLDLDDSPDQAS